jgi:hypothetical protein
MASADKMERRPSTSCLFSELDRGNKGKLTKDDILHFLGDKEQIDDVFKVLDADGDGIISAEDFETGFVEYVQKRKESVSGREMEKESSLGPSETSSLKEEQFEYDPDKGAPAPEFASVLDTFEDGKIKLLDIWKKLGETKPELREDFERFVCEIGDQVVGAKVAVKKYREETDRKVRELDKEFEEAILNTERRVRSQSFHSLMAKEKHFKQQLHKKSLEMETMRKEMVQMQSTEHTHRALKDRMSRLEEDKRELEEIMKQREQTDSNFRNGHGDEDEKGQPKTGAIRIAQLPPGIEAAVGQGTKKFKYDFKYTRGGWNRTNVSSGKTRSSSRSPEDGSSDSSREDTPPTARRGSYNHMSSGLGDDIQYWAENGQRRATPEASTLSTSQPTVGQPGNSPHPLTDPTTGTTQTSAVSSETSNPPHHSPRENSPLIHVESFESTDQGSPHNGRGTTSTADKRTSLEISDDSYGSPVNSPSVSRSSTLEKKRELVPNKRRREENGVHSSSRVRSSSLSRQRSSSLKQKNNSNLSPSHSSKDQQMVVGRAVTPSRGEVHPRVSA